MKLTIESTALCKALGAVIKAVPSKAMLPIYENVMFDVTANGMTLTATDGNMMLQCSAGCESDGEGKFLIGAKTLYDYIAKMPMTMATITTTESVAELTWEKGKSSFPCLDTKDWPDLGEDIKEESRIDFAELKGAVTHVFPSLSNDDLRPVMTGICLDNSEGEYAVASDGHALSAAPLTIDLKERYIMPPTLASAIRAMNAQGECTLSVSASRMGIEIGDVKMSARLIEGKYPNWRQVFPKEKSRTLKVSRQALIGAIDRVSVCASKVSYAVVLDFNPFSMELKSEDLDFSISARESIMDFALEGEGMSICFNGSFLRSVLSSMTCDEVTLDFIDDSHAVVFTGDGTKNLLMPVKL